MLPLFKNLFILIFWCPGFFNNLATLNGLSFAKDSCIWVLKKVWKLLKSSPLGTFYHLNWKGTLWITVFRNLKLYLLQIRLFSPLDTPSTSQIIDIRIFNFRVWIKVVQDLKSVLWQGFQHPPILSTEFNFLYNSRGFKKFLFIPRSFYRYFFRSLRIFNFGRHITL